MKKTIIKGTLCLLMACFLPAAILVQPVFASEYEITLEENEALECEMQILSSDEIIEDDSEEDSEEDSDLALCGANFYSNGLIFTITDDNKKEVEVAGAQADNTSGFLNIPAYVQYNSAKYTVTSIGKNAFTYQKDFTGLVIPNTVKSIGESAFESCSGMKGSLEIPTSVTSIGNSAFKYCSGFTGDIEIPDSVATIGKKAFYCATGFDGSVIIGSGITTIEESTFEGCSGLKGSLELGKNLVTIGKNAFLRCENLTGDITIPDSVVTIGDGAFGVCESITGPLVIGKKVETIGKNAFWACSKLQSRLVFGPSVKTIGEGAFAGDLQLYGNLSLPDTLTSIEATAFSGCSGFWGNLVIPNGVKSIKKSAFSRCTGFTGKLVLPGGLETIGDYAFHGCTGFSGSLRLPDKVTEIGLDSFQDCTGFTELELNGDLETIGEGAFAGCSNLKGRLVLPSKLKKLDSKAFQGCTGFTGLLVIPKSVNVIEFNTFDNVTGITVIQNLSNATITLPGVVNLPWKNAKNNEITKLEGVGIAVRKDNSQQYIYDIISEKNKTASIILYRGTDIGGLVIPESIDGYTITAIGDEAFLDLEGFDGNLTIPGTISSIGKSAFKGCKNLSGTLNIPESVIEIGDEAFRGCSGFKALDLPDTLEYIGIRAWYECSGISGRIVIPKNLESQGNSAFGGCNAITSFDNRSGKIIVLPTISGHTWINTISGNTVTQLDEHSIAIRDDYSGLIFVLEELSGNYATISGVEGESDEELIIPANYNGKLILGAKTQAFDSLTDVKKVLNNAATGITLPDAKGHYWIDEASGEIIKDRKLASGKTALRDDYPGTGLRIEGISGNGYKYSGSKIIPEIKVYDGNTLLTKGKDYTVAYSRNVNAYTLSPSDDGFNAKYAPAVTVTSKGNYSGKMTAYFCIIPLDITDNSIIEIPSSSVTSTPYTGRAYTPVPTITYGNRKLSKNKDFTVKYYIRDTDTEVIPKEAGKYSAKIVGKGNFTGEKIYPFAITSKGISVYKFSVGKIPNQPYKGSAYDEYDIKPVIKYNGKILEQDVDYRLAFRNNIDVGTASIRIDGIGDAGYIGTREVHFKITGTPLSKVKVTNYNTSYEYDGKPKEQPQMVLTYTGKDKVCESLNWKLKSEANMTDKDLDAVVSYENNVNAGTATVVITGVNKYTGTVKKTFKILPFPLDKDGNANMINVVFDSSVVKYTKTGAKPVPRLFYYLSPTQTIKLVNGKDYTISYLNNKVVSSYQAKVKITGKGNFSKSFTRNFAICEKSFTDGDVQLVVADKIYSASAGGWKSSVTVKENGAKLSAGRDYDKAVEYTYDYIPAGTVIKDGSIKSKPEVKRKVGEMVGNKDIVPAGVIIRVTVRAKGDNYRCFATTTYSIIQKSIGSYIVSVTPQIYTGSKITLTPNDITFKTKNGEVVTYEILKNTYTNNLNKGTAKVTLAGTGNYGGTKTITYSIASKKFLWWYIK